MANGLRGPLRVNGGNSLMRAGALGDGGDTPRSGSPAEEVFTDNDGSRAARFNTELVGNRFRELQNARPAQREAAIKAGLIHDEENPRAFDDPILLKGTCRDMCPEYEREEREFKKNVDRWELRDGPAGQQGRIDPDRAVSAFSRPAAGKDTGDEQVLPSDMRDPETLSRTLDYLFGTILTRPPHDSSIPATPFNSLYATHPFIWDRTRQIRQEFSKQKHWGQDFAVSGHERIARYHILCLRELRKTGINLQQEMEQLKKTLVSLTHYYNDIRMDTGRDMPCPNEAEFRAYLLVLDMFDPETARATSVLPYAVFSQPILRLAFDLHASVQRNFDTQKAASRGNIQVAQNFASRFFKLVRSNKVPFIMACLLESRFADVRRAGLRALHQSYGLPKGIEDPSKWVSVEVLMRLFGCVDVGEVVQMCKAVELQVSIGEEGPVGVFINKSKLFNDNRDPPNAEPWFSITAKQGAASYTDIINGVSGVQAGPASTSAACQATRIAPTAFGSQSAKSSNGGFLGFPAARPSMPAPSAPTPGPLQPSNRQLTAPPLIQQLNISFTPFAPPKPPTSALPVAPLAPPAPVPVVHTIPPRQPSPPPANVYYEEAVAEVATQLIEDTVHNITVQIASQVIKDLEQESIKAEQKARARQRGELLDYIAHQLYSSMIVDSTRQLAAGSLRDESESRELARTATRFWQRWARTQREQREERERRRLAFSQRMEAMRHGRLLVSQEDVSMEDAESDASRASHNEQDLAAVPDWSRAEELRKAQAERALFWEAGTYLDAVARHVSPLLPPSGQGNDGPTKLNWKVMVSATSQDTGKWLRRKLAVGKPPLHRDRGIISAISAPDRARSTRKVFRSTGLVIFELSRAALGSDEESMSREQSDGERLESLKAVLGPENEYRPVLLFVVWNNESMESICQRLGVDLNGTDHFLALGSIGLGRETADIMPLHEALGRTLVRVEIKPRFHLPLLPVIQAIYPLWTDLMLLATSVIGQGVQDWLDYSVILQLLIDSVNDLRRVVLTTIAPLYTGPSLGVPKLPVLGADSRIESERSATNALLHYVQNPSFAGMDDVALLVADVRQAVLQPQGPPTKLVIENLAFAVSSRLASNTLPLEVFLSHQDQTEQIHTLCQQAHETYSTIIISKMVVVEKLVKSHTVTSSAPVDDVFSAPETEAMSPIRALPDLSAPSALQASLAASQPVPSRKRRISMIPDGGSTSGLREQEDARETKMMRLRRLMGEVKRDLVV